MIVYETIRIVILTSEESQKMIGAHVIIIPVYTCLIGIILQVILPKKNLLFKIISIEILGTYCYISI